MYGIIIEQIYIVVYYVVLMFYELHSNDFHFVNF